MVQSIEIYSEVLKVILKPTRSFPNGKNYFYTDNNEKARELIKSYTWYLKKEKKNTCVVARIGASSISQKTLRFHQEYALRILGYHPDYIDHINGIEYDNRADNLNEVTNQQNLRNRPSIGYGFNAIYNIFQPYYVLDGRQIYSSGYKSESEALQVTYKLREEKYKDYNYNFFEDRRGFEHLLLQEIEGIITHEEATYQRIKSLIESNPWYAYRYNLEDYCKNNNIVIPDFSLDEQGFMIHPVTKQRLCPYN